jgi:hypothetical protein
MAMRLDASCSACSRSGRSWARRVASASNSSGASPIRLASCLGLERHAPDLATLLFVQSAEIFHEADDKIGLGEQQIDGKLDPQFLMQFA